MFHAKLPFRPFRPAKPCTAALSAAAAFARFIGLHRGTRDRAVGAVDAAVAGLRAQHLAAALTFIEPLAGVGWHRLRFGVPAPRASQGGQKLANEGVGRAGFGLRLFVHGLSLSPNPSHGAKYSMTELTRTPMISDGWVNNTIGI